MDKRPHRRNKHSFYDGIKQIICNIYQTLFVSEKRGRVINMDSLTFDVVKEYGDIRNYCVKSDNTRCVYYNKECHSQINEETLLEIMNDYLDVIKENDKVVEPTIENVAILNLYGNDTNVFPRIMNYYTDRYKKYQEFMVQFEEMKSGQRKSITIDMSSCYDFCVDDEIKKPHVHEIIDITCY